MIAGPADVLEAALGRAFAAGPPGAIGVALSGGGDSVALTVLLADWAAARGVSLHAATVNHHLRPEAQDEAEAAARLCRDLGLSHDVLHWQRVDPARGNLQDAARRARQRLLSDWAQGRGIGHVALGHSLDDQAETLLMRLARGSGVDGLSAMAEARRDARGVIWLRPLLAVPRAALRETLRARGIGWAEDPSNADPRFDRVRARRALKALAPLGIDAAGLAATAARMAQARVALGEAAVALCGRVASVDSAGTLQIASDYWDAPADLRERLLAQALMWLGQAEYRPRHAALRDLARGLQEGRSGTLLGCEARVSPDSGFWLLREYRAVADLSTAPGALWDGRWRLHPPPGLSVAGLRVAALGAAGLAQCPDWRRAGLARRALLSVPGAWCGAELVAAPLLRDDPGWWLELAEGRDELCRKL